MQPIQIQVRGRQAYSARASILRRGVAAATDLGWMAALAGLALQHWLENWDPGQWPGLSSDCAFALICLSLYGLQQLIWRATLGQAIWGLQLDIPRGVPIFEFFQNYPTAPLLQSPGRGPALSVVASALILSGATGAWVRAWYQQPLFAMVSQDWQIPPYTPPSGQTEWSLLSFFYSTGAWPKIYDGTPVLYSMPYEPGPPTQFVGHITARWAMPGINLVMEGPKTPAGWTGRARPSLEQVRDCLGSPLSRCHSLRTALLSRHLTEMHHQVFGDDHHAGHWTLRWFEVLNGAIPENERPQGIYLSLQGGGRQQDRFILITPSGAHQAFTLNRPADQRGDLAQKLFEQAIASQRLSEGLTTGRAWTDRQLAAAQVDDLAGSPASAAWVLKLSEVQSQLISKISVDPRGLEAYYHLGGISLLLARQARKTQNLEWAASAKPLLQSSYRYAKDLAPDHPRTRQLQDLWLTVKDW